MQDYKTEYQRWLNSSAIDEKTRAELLSVKDNEKEQEDRFYTELEFGTAGLRGILGAGTNRMNVYVVRRATAGLAAVISKISPALAARGVRMIRAAAQRNLLMKLRERLPSAAFAVLFFLPFTAFPSFRLPCGNYGAQRAS